MNEDEETLNMIWSLNVYLYLGSETSRTGPAGWEHVNGGCIRHRGFSHAVLYVSSFYLILNYR